MKGQRRADAGPCDQARPRHAARDRVNRNHAGGIGTIDGLRDVAQPHAPEQHADLPDGAGRHAHGGDDAAGVHSGGRLNGLHAELQSGAVIRLGGNPNCSRGADGEGGRRGQCRRGDAPERRSGRLLCRRSRAAEHEQSNNQQANALHAERLPWHVALSTQVNYLQSVTALGHTPLRLSELLTTDRIRVPIRAQSKEGVLRELVELLVGSNGAAPDGLQAVMERERQVPTGIGYGVAGPHGKTPALANLIAAAGTARTPVPYATVDGEPVRLFFLLAGPESQPGAHVNALSPISRHVRRGPIGRRLLATRYPQRVYPSTRHAEHVRSRSP